VVFCVFDVILDVLRFLALDYGLPVGLALSAVPFVQVGIDVAIVL